MGASTVVFVRWIAFSGGILLLAATASSVVKTLLLPRPANPVLTAVVARSVWRIYSFASDRIPDLARRERILSPGPPTFLISLLCTWLLMVVVGFALVLWPFIPGGFAPALRMSGSSVFTLGFAVPSGDVPSAIVVAASATGLAIVALLIAYLPALYAAFNRRETLVTMLEALGGTPPWGPELLARQALIENVAYLPRLYERWTEWAADISESHTNYRALLYFRSPDPTTSWVLSLLSVLDAAALQLSLCPDSSPSEARPLLRVGYIAMRRIAQGLRLAFDSDPRPEGPLELTRREFDEAVEWMSDAGWSFERERGEAWRHFRGWRVNYESAAYAIAEHLNVPPALWSGDRRSALPLPARPDRPPHRSPGTTSPGRARSI